MTKCLKWKETFLIPDIFQKQNMSHLNENVTEDNVTEFIVRYLGKQSINTQTLYPLTCIYAAFLFVGLLGNLATCTGM